MHDARREDRSIARLEDPTSGARLEILPPGAARGGILPDALVMVRTAQWFGSEALELTDKDPAGSVADELHSRHDEPGIDECLARRATVRRQGRAVPHLSVARDIRLAYSFDPALAVYASVANPLPGGE